MSNIKRHNKKNNDKLAGRLIAIQNIIRLHCEHTVAVIMQLKLKELLEGIPGLDIDRFNYAKTKLCEKMKSDDSIINRLSEVFYTEGGDSSIEMDKEAFEKFIGVVNSWITVNSVKDVVEGYNSSAERIDMILEGAKIANTSISGEEHEVIKY